MKPLRQTRLPIALSHKDCMRIINAVEHLVYRNCLLVMYSCGLRLGEAVKIQVSHIDKPTSILTIIGFSINDTIVIFDRVRENQKILRGKPLEES
jgi:integrase